MDGKKNSEKRSGRKRTFSKISDFFLKTNPISIVAGKFDNSNRRIILTLLTVKKQIVILDSDSFLNCFR